MDSETDLGDFNVEGELPKIFLSVVNRAEHLTLSNDGKEDDMIQMLLALSSWSYHQSADHYVKWPILMIGKNLAPFLEHSQEYLLNLHSKQHLSLKIGVVFTKREQQDDRHFNSKISEAWGFPGQK